MLIPPLAWTVAPASSKGTPNKSDPCGANSAFTPLGKAVAIGVPRVSIDKPRLGWLPLTKSRSEPLRMPFQLLLTAAIMLKPCDARSP